MRLVVLHRVDGSEVAINPRLISSIVPNDADTAIINLGPGNYDDQYRVLESLSDIVKKVRV